MQTCRHCNAKQLEGAIFCSECGASLITGHRRESTASLATGLPDPASDVSAFQRARHAPPQRYTICLVVIDSGRRMTLDASEDLLIGRKDNARGIYPDVDLGLDGGYEAGVSRRHAILVSRNGTYVIEDLGSANGTFVNERPCKPHTPVPLRHGDELAFGTLVLRIELE